jgi:DNA invertase Pin-like site-specific DNA recombinase
MDPTGGSSIVGIDWRAAKERLKARLDPDDQRIVDLLALGKSTPDIAKLLGTNRSAVWRRIQKIKEYLRSP